MHKALSLITITPMSGKVLVTDLDGTLFFPKSHVRMIPKSNVEFLKKWVHDGNRIVLNSSRGEYFAKKIFKKFGIPFDFIGCDGCYVRCDDKVIKESTFEPEPFKKLLTTLKRDFNPSVFIGSSKDRPILQAKAYNTFFGTVFYGIYMATQLVYREPCIRSDTFFYNEIEKGNMCKMMVCVGLSRKRQRLAYHLTQVLGKQYPEFQFFWLNQFIEITPKGCDKATGLAFYLDYLGIPKENVMVIGDSGNDIPMFDAFYEQSYCMAHSPKEVKVHAKNVISRVSDLKELLYPSADSEHPQKKGKKKR